MTDAEVKQRVRQTYKDIFGEYPADEDIEREFAQKQIFPVLEALHKAIAENGLKVKEVAE